MSHLHILINIYAMQGAPTQSRLNMSDGRRANGSRSIMSKAEPTICCQPIVWRKTNMRTTQYLLAPPSRGLVGLC